MPLPSSVRHRLTMLAGYMLVLAVAAGCHSMEKDNVDFDDTHGFFFGGRLSYQFLPRELDTPGHIDFEKLNLGNEPRGRAPPAPEEEGPSRQPLGSHASIAVDLDISHATGKKHNGGVVFEFDDEFFGTDARVMYNVTFAYAAARAGGYFYELVGIEALFGIAYRSNDIRIESGRGGNRGSGQSDSVGPLEPIRKPRVRRCGT